MLRRSLYCFDRLLTKFHTKHIFYLIPSCSLRSRNHFTGTISYTKEFICQRQTITFLDTRLRTTQLTFNLIESSQGETSRFTTSITDRSCTKKKFSIIICNSIGSISRICYLFFCIVSIKRRQKLSLNSFITICVFDESNYSRNISSWILHCFLICRLRRWKFCSISTSITYEKRRIWLNEGGRIICCQELLDISI